MHIIPDLKRLEAKYRDELMVIGVHSAKFSSEKETENIREAIERYDLEHPVINDKDYIVWNSYGVQAWPTVVLIDPAGKYVGARSGEGIYEPFDRAIGTLVQQFEGIGKLNRKPIKYTLDKEHKPKSVLSYPGKIAADAKSGRLFFTDSNHHRVIVSSLTGAIQLVIGEGAPGLKDGDFETARFFRPQGICFDAVRNALYVADEENHAIRKIDLIANKVTTLAGSGRQAAWPPTGGIGKSVDLSTPWDLTLTAPNSLYIAMAGTHQIWKLNLQTLKCEPFAGSARENLVDGPLADAQLAQPSGLTTDGTKLIFADSEASAIRTADLSPNGRVATILGKGLFEFGDKDGMYPVARLQHPLGVAFHDGFVYVADTYNHKIKKVNPRTRTVVTLVGTGKRGMADGLAGKASFSEPNGLTFVGGKLYIADTNNHMIRVYDLASKLVSTLKLTGIEKLAKKTVPAFAGTERRVPPQEISTAAKELELMIDLPKGTKFNKDAPFKIQATSDKPDSVTVGQFNFDKPAAKLAIPISAKSGEATITVELNVNYCSEGNEGLCYFKFARLVIPLKVGATGRASATATYTL